MGPRFLASAFTAGPALIILAMQVVRRVTASAPAGDASRLRGEGGESQRPKSRAATLSDLDLLGRELAELASVPQEVRKHILVGASVLEAKAGDVFLRQGETDKTPFFVLKGRVVVRREEGGRFRITRSLGPGEQFGEISALAGTPRTGTAIAEEPSQILSLPVAALQKLMASPRMNKIIRARMS